MLERAVLCTFRKQEPLVVSKPRTRFVCENRNYGEGILIDTAKRWAEHVSRMKTPRF
jgi:hypothetical protein